MTTRSKGLLKGFAAARKFRASLGGEVNTRRVFPLAVGQLAHVAAMRVHEKHLGVGLRRGVVERRFILEARAGAFEPDLAPIDRPCGMSIGAARRGEPLHV